MSVIGQVMSTLRFAPCTLSLAKSTLHRLYSRGVAPRNWQLAGHVSPTSLIVDDDAPSLDLSEDEPPPQPQKRPNATPTPEEWRQHREKLKEAFPDGWNPPRKLSREAMDGLRSLHAFDSNAFSCEMLAEKFKISPEGVRRILRSKWEPSREKRAQLAERDRRSREDWIAKRRFEEKREAAQILLEARQNKQSHHMSDMDDRANSPPRSSRVKSNDKFFFR